MSWQDRDYYRDDESGSCAAGGGFGQKISRHSVTFWLIAINIAIFLYDILPLHLMHRAEWSAQYWGAFNLGQATYGVQIWRWLTYQFLHANLMHLLFNMAGLYWFGSLVERHLGTKRYIVFYLLCGFSGAWVFSLLTLLGYVESSPFTVLVGASGSIYGLLAATAVLAPHMRVMLLFPPIPMSMRTLAIGLLAIAGIAILTQGDNAGGEAAHLGGAALGFILIQLHRHWPAGTLGPLSSASHRTLRSNRVEPGPFRGWRPEAGSPAAAAGKKSWLGSASSDQRTDDLEAEVDRILGKVKSQGLQSLSEKEKQTLQQATDRHRHRG